MSKICSTFLYSCKGQQITCSNANRVRLNDAGYFFADDRVGRVEICNCLPTGCEWKTITVPTGSVSWGWKNALVACREIYPEDYGVMNPILQDTYVKSN